MLRSDTLSAPQHGIFTIDTHAVRHWRTLYSRKRHRCAASAVDDRRILVQRIIHVICATAMLAADPHVD